MVKIDPHVLNDQMVNMIRMPELNRLLMEIDTEHVCRRYNGAQHVIYAEGMSAWDPVLHQHKHAITTRSANRRGGIRLTNQKGT